MIIAKEYEKELDILLGSVWCDNTFWLKREGNNSIFI